MLNIPTELLCRPVRPWSASRFVEALLGNLGTKGKRI
jgi:hypothetical protein